VIVGAAVSLVLSPLLRHVTTLARWLPDQAGQLLYLPSSDPGLTATGGALVALVWIAAVAAGAAIAFVTRDT
jgi:ABC-2 type transport system permease protein